MFLQPDFKVGTGAVLVWKTSGFSRAFEGENSTDIVIPMGEIDVNFSEAVAQDVVAPDLENLVFSTQNGQFVRGLCQLGAGDCGGGNFVIGGGTANTVTFERSPADLRFVAARAFPKPGTYEYHSTIHGTSGRIVVVTD